MILKGTIVRSKEGKEYEVIKRWFGGWYDLQALQPMFDILPDYYPIIYSQRLEGWEILNESSCAEGNSA